MRPSWWLGLLPLVVLAGPVPVPASPARAQTGVLRLETVPAGVTAADPDFTGALSNSGDAAITGIRIDLRTPARTYGNAPSTRSPRSTERSPT